MNGLTDFIDKYVERDECRCGKCIDVGNKPDLTEHTADMIFFKVCLKSTPDSETLRQLFINNDFLNNMVDGQEHNYIEVGAWVGDQGIGLMLMGAGSLLKLWDLRTPRTMLPPGLSDDLVMQMAGQGMVAISKQ